MMDIEPRYSILLVDDEEIFRKHLALAFSRRGFTVYEAGDFASAVGVLQEWAPDRIPNIIDFADQGEAKGQLAVVAVAARAATA